MILDVYTSGLTKAFRTITELLPRYPIVAIDTEFPGFFDDQELSSSGHRYASSEAAYARIKASVDATKLIQLGISISDHTGRMPEPFSAWQFNLQFDLKTDLSTSSAIALLEENGLDFARHRTDGIDPKLFSAELLTSGFCQQRNMVCICFHGSYDFAYVVRALLSSALPPSASEFHESLHQLLPGPIYDLKTCYSWHGSLAGLASDLGVGWVGMHHQAGSDAYTTLRAFHELAQKYGFPPASFSHALYGLDSL